MKRFGAVIAILGAAMLFVPEKPAYAYEEPLGYLTLLKLSEEMLKLEKSIEKLDKGDQAEIREGLDTTISGLLAVGMAISVLDEEEQKTLAEAFAVLADGIATSLIAIDELDEEDQAMVEEAIANLFMAMDELATEQ